MNREMDSMMSLDVPKEDSFCSGAKAPAVAIFRAVKRGDVIKTIDIVQKTGPDILQARNSQGLTLLHNAVRKGHLEIVRQLLQWHAVDLDAITPNGETALYLAASRGHTQILLTLLDRGAHPDGGEGRFMTALDEMMRNFCDANLQLWDEAMCAMLKRGARCSRVYLGISDSVFEWICRYGLPKCARLLMTNRQISYAPRDNLRLIKGALGDAMRRNKTNIIRQFAEQWNSCFPELVTGGTTFNSFFHEAVLSGQLDVVRVFLDHGTTVDEIRPWKIDGDTLLRTPVELAILCGYEEIAIALFERGADRDTRGTPSLIFDALGHGCESLVVYLLDKNTDPLGQFDECPVSPFYRAVKPADPCSERLTLDRTPATQKMVVKKYSDMVGSGLLERYPMIKLGQLVFLSMTGRASLLGTPTTDSRKQELIFRTIASMIHHRLCWDIQKIILRMAVRHRRIMSKPAFKGMVVWYRDG